MDSTRSQQRLSSYDGITWCKISWRKVGLRWSSSCFTDRKTGLLSTFLIWHLSSNQYWFFLFNTLICISITTCKSGIMIESINQPINLNSNITEMTNICNGLHQTIRRCRTITIQNALHDLIAVREGTLWPWLWCIELLMYIFLQIWKYGRFFPGNSCTYLSYPISQTHIFPIIRNHPFTFLPLVKMKKCNLQ